ncbi:cytochrome d ubiquinol oxidase subunit II [Novosphingobium mangrovi (ex Huang et al. 2023)]|uniref:Cytochrome d ubiquinol oxidase subunit II n=1 Tax=Novosphingobium mangrovi (ex Huang et al. 2023) TaxID=2976432 RepID=A0ABT2I567_9SPHN|nr:cytochrome d ubiquinol oxidase subunit II [Novosphingobium mangrovi (ex Huang et al. 2023)]MCT2399953.1 cytochrome d ubiquinol oxidase subunit II [Novosphingobium mangrovi (ex Huang et al. 2023)]
MEIPLDYETLRMIWWALLGVLLIGFTLTDGYDLGVATLLPFIGKTDEERRLTINSIAAHWEGHQVWFILGGGAIFAAWPFVYAVSFSGFYLAMFLVLAALILRPVGFKYRSKRPDPAWRSRWDWALFIGGFVPALVFGVAVGNVLQGLPFRLDSDLRTFYEGSLLGLFSPFALMTGLLSVAMVVMHGAGFLAVKIEEGPVLERARRIGGVAAMASIVLFVLGGVWVAMGSMGFRIDGLVDPQGPSNPHYAQTVAAPGAWLDNYGKHAWMLLAPIMGLAGPVLALIGIRRRSHVLNLAGSSMATTGIIATVGLSMFPFILPSSIDAQSSLTAWNASSSHLTLWIMLLVTLIFLPLVLAYTAWVMKVLFGRVTIEQVRTNPDFY